MLNKLWNYENMIKNWPKSRSLTSLDAFSPSLLSSWSIFFDLSAASFSRVLTAQPIFLKFSKFHAKFQISNFTFFRFVEIAGKNWSWLPLSSLESKKSVGVYKKRGWPMYVFRVPVLTLLKAQMCQSCHFFCHFSATFFKKNIVGTNTFFKYLKYKYFSRNIFQIPNTNTFCARYLKYQ